MPQFSRPVVVCDCPHCHAPGRVTRPSALWRVAVVAAWISLVAEVAAASLVGPFILVVGPIVALSGAGLLSFVHGKASRPATCEACGKIVVTTRVAVAWPKASAVAVRRAA